MVRSRLQIGPNTKAMSINPEEESDVDGLGMCSVKPVTAYSVCWVPFHSRDIGRTNRRTRRPWLFSDSCTIRMNAACVFDSIFWAVLCVFHIQGSSPLRTRRIASTVSSLTTTSHRPLSVGRRCTSTLDVHLLVQSAARPRYVLPANVRACQVPLSAAYHLCAHVSPSEF